MRLHLSTYLSPQCAIRWTLRCCPWPFWQVPQKTPRFPGWRISTPSAALPLGQFSNMFYLGKLSMVRVFFTLCDPHVAHGGIYLDINYYILHHMLRHSIGHLIWHTICHVVSSVTWSNISFDILFVIFDLKHFPIFYLTYIYIWSENDLIWQNIIWPFFSLIKENKIEYNAILFNVK